MSRLQISAEEWEVLVKVADRLEIDLRGLLEKDVRFIDYEAASHAFGRALARATTERLTLARSQRLSGMQPCPTCHKLVPVTQRSRNLETADGSIDLSEGVGHCSACRRDFFPSASCLGIGSAAL